MGARFLPIRDELPIIKRGRRINPVGLVQSQRQWEEIVFVFLYTQIHRGIDTEMYIHMG